MKIQLKRINNSHFKATNPQGNQIFLDGPEKVGGKDLGFRPMETVLAGLASCSAIDILLILQQGQQEIKDFSINVEGERTNDIPAVFQKIHLHFKLTGNIVEKKLQRALDLSINKYCSVAKMLQPPVKINYTYQLN